MPRLVHQNPAYRLHRSDGRAVVTIGGRDIFLGRHGTKAKHLTQKQRPITRGDLDEFVDCHKPGAIHAIHKRKQTWSDTSPDAGIRRT